MRCATARANAAAFTYTQTNREPETVGSTPSPTACARSKQYFAKSIRSLRKARRSHPDQPPFIAGPKRQDTGAVLPFVILSRSGRSGPHAGYEDSRSATGRKHERSKPLPDGRRRAWPRQPPRSIRLARHEEWHRLLTSLV